MKSLDLSKWDEYKAHVAKINCDIHVFNCSLFKVQRTEIRRFLFWQWDVNIYNNPLAIELLCKKEIKVTIEGYIDFLTKK